MTGWDQPVTRPQGKVAHGLLRFASPDIWESDIPPRVEGHEGGWGVGGGGHPQCYKKQNVGANGATNQNQSLISVISERSDGPRRAGVQDNKTGVHFQPSIDVILVFLSR